MRPHLAEEFAEHDDALVSDFEGAYPWNHAVAVGIAVVRNQLTVTVMICPCFRDSIKDELNFWVEGLHCLLNYKQSILSYLTLSSEVFVLSGVVASVPLVRGAVLAELNHNAVSNVFNLLGGFH